MTVPTEKNKAFIIGKDEKQYLLALARRSISTFLKTSQELALNPGEIEKISKNSVLRRNLGCFVTLKKNDELRGCIGLIQAESPLYLNIIDYANNAAFKDPRFDPLKEDELDSIHLEISVMGPVEPLEHNHLEQIEVGRHGLIVKQGFHQGLLLPQVPIEWNWDRTTFLEQTCLKAGLPRNAYLDQKTEIYYFTATVFGE